MAKVDIYQTVTDRIVDHLVEVEQAGEKWTKPWFTVGNTVPKSIDGRPYRGMNFLLLSLLADKYPAQVFGTYRAWKRKDAQVRKGERGIMVVLWRPTERRAKDGEKADENGMVKSLFLKHYTVFAAEQVDGYELPAIPEVEPIAEAERVTAAYHEAERVGLGHGGNRAFYAPSRDSVQMPEIGQFKDAEAYHATHLHELVHSTGHETRLDRQFGQRFGDEAYAFEELVAELGSAMLCAQIGLSPEPRRDHAQYLSHWLGILGMDKKAIFTASSQAQKAADLVLQASAAEDEDEAELEAA